MKRIKKPNAFIFFICCILAKPVLRFRYGMRTDKSGLSDMKEPALVLCPHISNMDFVVVALTLFPHRPTFVVSDHFMLRPLIRWFLNKMHVIPKKMFCPDVRTIISILRARDSGNIVVLFPEGRLPAAGHSVQVTDGTAELVKKMGVDVYTVTGNGAYKTLPKWGKAGLRPGRIEVSTSKLLDAESLKGLSVAEINHIIEKAVLHDEDSVLTDVSYRCKRPAEGLENVLYKCPSCGEEFTMTASGSRISCTACGSYADLDSRYRLRFSEEHKDRRCAGPFETINQWYFWQESAISLDEPLRSDTAVASADENGNIDWNAGSGVIYMDRDVIRFDGTCFGKELSFEENTRDIKALPVSLGHHFDLYHDRKMYNFILQPEPACVIKWTMYMDKLTKERES